MPGILNFEPSWPEITENLLVNEAWEKGFAQLAKHNLSFDLQINPHQLAQAHAVMERNPEVPVIINHSGLPKSEADLDVWRAGMKLLAAMPQVSIKVSANPGYPDKDLIFPKLFPEILELFGHERVMFASNYPVALMVDELEPVGLYKTFLEMISHLSATEQQGILADNAKRIYRLS